MSFLRLKQIAEELVKNQGDPARVAGLISELEPVTRGIESDPYLQDLHYDIEKQWLGRASAQNLSPGTGKRPSRVYVQREIDFFCGAMAAFNAILPRPDARGLSSLVPPKWIFNPMTGKLVVDAKDHEPC